MTKWVRVREIGSDSDTKRTWLAKVYNITEETDGWNYDGDNDYQHLKGDWIHYGNPNGVQYEYDKYYLCKELTALEVMRLIKQGWIVKDPS
jgi:hypothetical protein